MRSIPDSQAIAMIAIMSLLTFFVRGFPYHNPFSLPAVFWKIQDTCLHHVPRKSTSLRYHRYAGGLLLQEYFPAAGTVRTARADRRHCHRSGTLLEEKYASLRWRRDTVLHVSCSDNF